MASMLIKNLPDDLHQELKQRAKRHHRSLNKEVIALLEGVLRDLATDAFLDSQDVRQARANRLRALRGNYRSSLSSSEAFAEAKSDELAQER